MGLLSYLKRLKSGEIKKLVVDDETIIDVDSIYNNGVTAQKNAMINAGYMLPQGSVDIVTNGSHNVKGKATANVNVPRGQWGSFVTGASGQSVQVTLPWNIGAVVVYGILSPDNPGNTGGAGIFFVIADSNGTRWSQNRTAWYSNDSIGCSISGKTFTFSVGDSHFVASSVSYLAIPK